MKWFFEGVLGMAVLEVFCLALGLVCILLRGRVRVAKPSLPWLLFALNIPFSLLVHGSEVRLWGRGMVFVFITMYVFFFNFPVLKYKRIMRFLVGLGFLTGGMILVHYVLGSGFNSLYFPLLNATAKDLAQRYYSKGYRFGFMYNPHEAAGLVAFAIAALVLRKQLLRARKKNSLYVLALVLMFLLLLTGKRAILILIVLSIVMTILLLYGSRKQIVRSLCLVVGGLLVAGVFVLVALKNPQIGIFSRFSGLLQSIIAGSAFDDTGRMKLYIYAINEWKDNPILGIGWKSFSGLTTAKYHSYRAHEVNCDYLQWLCETGVVGFVLSMIPVTITAYRAVIVGRKLIRNYHTVDEQWILLMAVCIQIFTLAYAFVEIPFFDIVFYSVYILSCIVINSAYARRHKKV